MSNPVVWLVVLGLSVLALYGYALLGCRAIGRCERPSPLRPLSEPSDVDLSEGSARRADILAETGPGRLAGVTVVDGEYVLCRSNGGGDGD